MRELPYAQAAVVIFLDELQNLEAIEDLCRNVRASMTPNNQTSKSVACLQLIAEHHVIIFLTTIYLNVCEGVAG